MSKQEHLPFQTHSDTSRSAAHLMRDRARGLREDVYSFVASRGRVGATDEELQSALPIGPNTARPRRVELVAEGRVVDSGRTRETKSGRKATVWVAAQHADSGRVSGRS